MTEESENTPKIEPETEKVVEPEIVAKEEPMEEVKDLIPELYREHGGDPRAVNLNFAVLLSGIPTDFITDAYEQFNETLRTMLKMGHNLNPDNILKIIRIPVLEEGVPNKNNALRALVCFSDKIQQCRCLARKKQFEDDNQRVEAIDVLPEALLFISEEDRLILENGVHEQQEEENEDDNEEVMDELMNDDVIDDDDEEEEEEEEGGHDEHEDSDDEENIKKQQDNHQEEQKKDAKDGDKKDEANKKPEEIKKKVYEDEDEKAPFEMQWEGAPEFQWRLCEGNRDEKKLIIENLMWADLNDIFIYRTIQKATTCEINFPARFAGEGYRATHGKLTLFFPGFVAIMDEALKHLVYFRSGDNRRIKVFLPQTTTSLKRKEEFEAKLGRLIKPTQRMMELVIKILPDGYTPTLDDACEWFPDQSVIGCDLVNDEMGKPCAIVKFETAQEAVTAHASKSFVSISQKKTEKKESSSEIKKEASEKEDVKDGEPAKDEKLVQCNVFMRGVEAHFGSLLTFYDQRKKAQEQHRQNRQNRQKGGAAGGGGGGGGSTQKRPAGSTIRGPVQKKRALSPKPGQHPRGKDATTPRGGSGGGPRGGGGGGSGARNPRGGGSSAPRRSSPMRSSASRQTPRGNSSRGIASRGGSGGGGSHPRGGSGGSSRGGGGGRGGRTGGGDRGSNRSAPRSNNYRTDSFSSSSSQRVPQRAEAFSGYGYAHFDSRYNGGSSNDRPTVDPFGRPVYSVPAFSNSSSSSFHRDDSHRGSGGFSSSSSFQDNRRRY